MYIISLKVVNMLNLSTFQVVSIIVEGYRGFSTVHPLTQVFMFLLMLFFFHIFEATRLVSIAEYMGLKPIS